MSTKIAVNLPVKNLAESTRFFSELGFSADRSRANATTETFVISDEIFCCS
ncbi:MAG TPA: hypothetical protein VKB37_14380 [Jatrophihabitantaceae bacterium]|nr:hypothetical protein [Jatrophihabitantaceae bacterium]